MADLFDRVASGQGQAASATPPSQSTPAPDLFDRVAQSGEISSAQGSTAPDLFDRVASVAPSNSPTNEQPKAWYEKAWDYANTPLFDFKAHLGGTGFLGGVEDVASSLTSPLSALLFIGTMGTDALVESGGAAALKAAGMAADDIAQVTKGAEIASKAAKTGQNLAEAVQSAGLNPSVIAKGGQILKDAGLGESDLFGGGLFGRGIVGPALRAVNVTAHNAATAAKITQGLVDAGFSYWGVKNAVEQSPSFLDAVSSGDWDKAQELGVNILAGSYFGLKGAQEVFRDSGSLISNAQIATKFKIKPTEQAQAVTEIGNRIGSATYDMDQAAKEYSQTMDKLNPLKDEIDQLAMFVRHDIDKNDIIKEHNRIAESYGKPEEKLPYIEPPSAHNPLNTGQIPLTKFSGTHYSPVPDKEGVIPGNTRDISKIGQEGPRLQHDNAVEGVYVYPDTVKPEPNIGGRKFRYPIRGDKAIADISGPEKPLWDNAKNAKFAEYKQAGDNDLVATQKATNDAEQAIKNAGYDGYGSSQQPKQGVFLFGDQPVAPMPSPGVADNPPAKLFYETNDDKIKSLEHLTPDHENQVTSGGVGVSFTNKPGNAEGTGFPPKVSAGILNPRAKMIDGNAPLKPYVLDSLRAQFFNIVRKVDETAKPEDIFAKYSAGKVKSFADPGITYMDIIQPLKSFLADTKKVDLNSAEIIPELNTFQKNAASFGYDGVHYMSPDGSVRNTLLFPQDVADRYLTEIVHPSGRSAEITPDESRVWQDDLAGEVASRNVRNEDVAQQQKLLNTKNYKAGGVDKILEAYKRALTIPDDDPYLLASRAKFRELFDIAQQHKLIREPVENYITHLWGENKDNPVVNRAIHDSQSGKFDVDIPMARRRVFATITEGILHGFKLEATDPTEIAAHYMRVMGRAIANREGINEVMDKGIVDSYGRPAMVMLGNGHVMEGPNGEAATLVNPNGVRNLPMSKQQVDLLKKRGQLEQFIQEGAIRKVNMEEGKPPKYAWDTSRYIPEDHPSFRDFTYATKDSAGKPVYAKTSVAISPEMHDHILRQFGLEKSSIQESAIGKGILKTTAEAKSLLLSGSPFHAMQLGLRMVMQGLNPIVRFGIHRLDSDPVLRMGIEKGGLELPTYKGFQQYMEGNVADPHSKIISKIPGLSWLQGQMQHFIFQQLMPEYKIRSFKDLFAQETTKHPDWTPEAVSKLAAQSVNERFGGLNYREMGRSAATQDFLKLTALAPDWLESNLRFIKRAVVGGDEGAIARKDIIRMTALLWAGTRLMNYVISGKPHNEAPFGVALTDDKGKEKIYSIRTVPTDMLHMVSDPVGFMRGRVSPLVRAGSEAYTGRDYAGRKQTPGQTFADVLENFAPIPAQAIGKGLTGQAADLSTPDQIAKASGLTVQPYRTQAQQKSLELSSNRNEQGPVDPAQLRRHQLLMQWEGDLRAGKMQPDDVHQLVEDGNISVKEGKDIFKNLKETRGMSPEQADLYTHASRLPMKDFLEIWRLADNDEKAGLTKLLLAKKKAYFKRAFQDMTPAERQTDPTYRWLRQTFPNEAPY